jgi:nitroreductase
MFDVALAMKNMALATHSLGLSTIHIGAFDPKSGKPAGCAGGILCGRDDAAGLS